MAGRPLPTVSAPEALLASTPPVCLPGTHWASFRLARDVFGFTVWGRPAMEDVQALTRALEVELEPAAPPHRSLVDTRRLEGVDAGAFEVLHRYVTRHHARLSRQVTKLALIRPPGLPGAVVAGFYRTLDSPYPTEVFDEPSAAARWLALDLALVQRLDETVDGLRGIDPLVARLRALLEDAPGLAVGDAAKRLALSARTLQRRLSDAGTTFVDESLAARVRTAQRLLLDSDAPLTAIAIDAGFSTPQHFSFTFKKVTGQSPSAWRSARRVSTP
ncbi:MAG: helix-turn-helix transcriptional regulator [Myxococcota bacterium]